MAPEQVTAALRSRLYGDVTTQVKRGPKMVGVRLWIPEADRRTIAEIEQLRLRAPDGHLVPLKRIATIEPIIGQPQISRDDLKRMVAVTARISARDMGSTVTDVITAL